MKTASVECLGQVQEMIWNCDNSYVPDSEKWLTCRQEIVNPMLNGRWSRVNGDCYTCQRDVEYSYLCNKHLGCTQIAYQVENFCPSEIVIKDTNATSMCDIRWVNERSLSDFYFTCDTACLEFYPEESSDCQSGCNNPNDVCGVW
jgi:hypothetical protein